MNTRIFSAAFAIMLASTATSALAQDFDVAGVKLGMDFETADALLSEAGYEPYIKYRGAKHIDRGATFAQEVQIAEGTYIPQKERTGYSTAEYVKGDNKERIGIAFVELPSGEAVSQISYGLREPTMSAEEFFAKVEAKYGARARPTSKTVDGDQNFMVDGFKMSEDIWFGQRSSFVVRGTLEPQARRRAIEAARPKTEVETF